MDISFSPSADFVLLTMLGPYTDPDGMIWSDGVSQAQYDEWCTKNTSPSQDIRAVSWTPTKKQIVSDLYWMPNARLLPPGADYLFLDAAWYLGVTNAIKVFQTVLGVPLTGIIDDATKTAFGHWRLPLDEGFVNSFCDEYEGYIHAYLDSHPPEEARLRHYLGNRVAQGRVNAVTIIRMGLR